MKYDRDFLNITSLDTLSDKISHDAENFVMKRMENLSADKTADILSYCQKCCPPKFFLLPPSYLFWSDPRNNTLYLTNVCDGNENGVARITSRGSDIVG